MYLFVCSSYKPLLEKLWFKTTIGMALGTVAIIVGAKRYDMGMKHGFSSQKAG
jgi:hypothetical protein